MDRQTYTVQNLGFVGRTFERLSEDANKSLSCGVELAEQPGYYIIDMAQSSFVAGSEVVLELLHCTCELLVLRKAILCFMHDV